MRSETRFGKMRTGGVHRQGDKSINHLLQQLAIFTQIWFSLQSTTSKNLNFLFSFDSFKSLKPRAIRY